MHHGDLGGDSSRYYLNDRFTVCPTLALFKFVRVRNGSCIFAVLFVLLRLCGEWVLCAQTPQSLAGISAQGLGCFCHGFMPTINGRALVTGD